MQSAADPKTLNPQTGLKTCLNQTIRPRAGQDRVSGSGQRLASRPTQGCLAPAKGNAELPEHPQNFRNYPLMLSYGQHTCDPVSRAPRGRNPAVNAFVGNWNEQVSKAKLCISAALQHWQQIKERTRLENSNYEQEFEALEVLQPHRVVVRLELPESARGMHPVFHVFVLRLYNLPSYNANTQAGRCRVQGARGQERGLKHQPLYLG
jgi:hypothetical protein